MRIKNREDFIKASKEQWNDFKNPSENKFDYKDVEYKTKDKEIILTCIEHQLKFEQTPNANLAGTQGCFKCSKRPKNSEQLKEILKENFRQRYNYSHIKYNGKKSELITLNCKEHGEFSRLVKDLINGKHCRACMVGLSLKDFIKRAENHHGVGTYDYSKVSYANTKDKVTVICKDHGEFLIEVSSILKGHGCQDCGKIKNKITFEKFHKRALETHNDKYEYSKDYWSKGNTHTKIKCKTHGWFTINWYNHIKGGGCKDCYIESKKLSILEIENRIY